MSQTPRPIFRPRTSSDGSPRLPERARKGFQSLQRQLPASHSQASPQQVLVPTASSSWASDIHNGQDQQYVSIDDFPRTSQTLHMPSFDDKVVGADEDEILEQSGHTTPLYHMPSTDGGAFSAWALLAARFSSRSEFEDY